MRLRTNAEGLLLADVTITHQGYTFSIADLVIDTGAVQSLISIDTVDAMFKRYDPSDQLHFMRGIGGAEPAIRRTIDHVRLGDFEVEHVDLDFGSLHEHGITGLIGLDLLLTGKFVINLVEMELHSNNGSLGAKSDSNSHL